MNVPRNVADVDRRSEEWRGKKRTGLSDGSRRGERDPISESSEFSNSHRDESTREHNIWRWQRNNGWGSGERAALNCVTWPDLVLLTEGSIFSIQGLCLSFYASNLVDIGCIEDQIYF